MRVPLPLSIEIAALLPRSRLGCITLAPAIAVLRVNVEAVELSNIISDMIGFVLNPSSLDALRPPAPRTPVAFF